MISGGTKRLVAQNGLMVKPYIPLDTRCFDVVYLQGQDFLFSNLCKQKGFKYAPEHGRIFKCSQIINRKLLKTERNYKNIRWHKNYVFPCMILYRFKY